MKKTIEFKNITIIEPYCPGDTSINFYFNIGISQFKSREELEYFRAFIKFLEFEGGLNEGESSWKPAYAKNKVNMILELVK